MGTQKITGLVDPTAAQDAATKTYVDALLIDPAYALLFNGLIPGGGVANFDVEGWFDSKYEAYEVFCHQFYLHTGAADELRIQLNINGGGFRTGATDYLNSGGPGGTGQAALSGLKPSAMVANKQFANGFSFKIISNRTGTRPGPRFSGVTNWFLAAVFDSTNWASGDWGGSLRDTTATDKHVTGLRFNTFGGRLLGEGGRVTVYGIKH